MVEPGATGIQLQDEIQEFHLSSSGSARTPTPKPTMVETEDDIETDQNDDDKSASKQASARRKRSKVWEHYSVQSDKDGKLVGICKYCNVTKYNADSRFGTSNFSRHLHSCPEYKKQNLDGSSSHMEKFDQAAFRKLVAEATLRHGYSFSWVEHEGIRKLFKFFSDEAEVVSRNSLKKDCLNLHADLKENIKHVLTGLPGKICLTSDLWTACTSRGYLCVTAHYIDLNWKLHSKLLCFRHCPPPHGGFELSSEMTNVLLEWGIEKKIFSLTVDNASNMDKMISILKQGVMRDLMCQGKHFHIRCCAHILNLIVKDGLEVIDICVSKVREGIRYIDGSEARMQRFEECVKKFAESFTCGLWLDVPTRWNSTYIMLHKALKYRKVLSYYFSGIDGGKYALSAMEWGKVEKICSLLEPFYNVTKIFSGSDYPTASLYFPLVWKIHTRLQSIVTCDDIDISVAAIGMLEKFNKYWSEYVTVLAFGIIFDPRYKWDFVNFALTKVHGPIDGEKMANKVRVQFDELYKEYESVIGVQRNWSAGHMPDEVHIDFDGIEEFACFDQAEQSEVDTYLREKRLNSRNLDVLNYWKENSCRFPILSSMARDVLAIPITTVASESTFSMGGRILNKWRSSLLSKNVEALVTTKNWLTGYDDFTEEGIILNGSAIDDEQI